MNKLNRAIILATNLHAYQNDKSGEPYILHVLAVMLSMHTEEERIVALLHDVVEDGHETLGGLEERGYSVEVLAALDAITRRKSGETYAAYIERVSENRLATAVKIADLRHNLGRLHRLPISDERRSLEQRYINALRYLGV